MGTQKNRLNETVLFSAQTYVNTDGKDNIYNFMFKTYVLQGVNFSSFPASDQFYRLLKRFASSLEPDQERPKRRA